MHGRDVCYNNNRSFISLGKIRRTLEAQNDEPGGPAMNIEFVSSDTIPVWIR